MHLNRRSRTLTALVALALLTSGCAAAATSTTPTVESIPTTEPSTTPATEPTAAAEGSRTNPLPVGAQRKFSDASMWSVGAEGPTTVGDGYVVLPLHLTVDWEAGRAQGGDVDTTGVDPWSSIFVTYVTAGGQSYDTFDQYTVDVGTQLFDIGSIYPPLETVSASVPISVPAEEIAGGVWSISNSQGSKVFLATQ